MSNPERDRFEPTLRTKLRRIPDRGHYDRETIDRILDEGFLCHVGFIDAGQPYVIPTLYVRLGTRFTSTVRRAVGCCVACQGEARFA